MLCFPPFYYTEEETKTSILVSMLLRCLLEHKKIHYNSFSSSFLVFYLYNKYKIVSQNLKEGERSQNRSKPK